MHPIRVFEDGTLKCDRGTQGGLQRLCPTAPTRDAIGYITLYWARRYGIRLLAMVILNSRIHVVVEDPLGLHPLFRQMVNHWIARVLNKRLGNTGNYFFERAPDDKAACLGNDADVEEQLVELMMLPTAQRICRYASDWNGYLFGPDNAGRRVTFPRPPELTNPGKWPETMTLTVPKPRRMEHKSYSKVRSHFRRLVARREADVHAGHLAAGREYIGVDEALAVDPESSDPNPSPRVETLFISSDPQLVEEFHTSRSEFVKEHGDRRTELWVQHRTGSPTIPVIVWPPGTFRMHHTHGFPRLDRTSDTVQCSDRPPPVR